MPFPLIALLTAAASDAQQRSAHGDQVFKAGHDAEARIMQARARQLGGSPYPGMAQDFRNSLEDMRRQSDASRNNNIGALLQAYLKSDVGGRAGEKFGDDYDPSNLQGGFGAGNVMGKAQMDPWDKDPWGDAGY